MAIKQSIWCLDTQKELSLSSLASENELEDIISKDISILSLDWIILGRQVRTYAGGYIDMLCMDASGNRIVVELKKELTPREVTAQAIDYAACVSEMRSEVLEQIYLDYHKKASTLSQAFKEKFGIDLADDNADANVKNDKNVKMVIVAAKMDACTERIVKYLWDRGIDINVLFFSVYEHQGQRLLSRAWMIDENIVERAPAAKREREWNGEYYTTYGAKFGANEHSRSWADAVKYGFLSAGGREYYYKALSMLQPGDRIWTYIPQAGYVGVGEVLEPVAYADEVSFEHNGGYVRFRDLPLKGAYALTGPQEKMECIVKVKWIETVDELSAVREFGFFANQNVACRPKGDGWDFTIRRLKELWAVE